MVPDVGGDDIIVAFVVEGDGLESESDDERKDL